MLLESCEKGDKKNCRLQSDDMDVIIVQVKVFLFFALTKIEVNQHLLVRIS